MTIRWATHADLAAFYGDKVPTCRALSAVMGGRLVGVAGWRAQSEGVYVFSRVTGDLKAARVALFKAAKMVCDLLPSPSWCVADPEEKTAAAFLTRLGWRSVGASRFGEVFEWRRH